MQAIEFLSAQFGAVMKNSGEFDNLKVIGIMGTGATGCVIVTLQNHAGTDRLAKYVVADTVVLAPGTFIRVDGHTDHYFKKIKITGTAIFILGKP